MEKVEKKVQAKDPEMTAERKAVVEKMLKLRSKARHDISARIMKEVDDEYKMTVPSFVRASGR